MAKKSTTTKGRSTKDSTALVKREQAPPPATAEDVAAMMAQDAGAGVGDIGSDTTTPFLNIIQTNSPQINPRKDQWIEGAQAGQIFNSVTQDVWDELEVVPVAYQRHFVEWKPRTEGGGFVRNRSLDDPIIRKCSKGRGTTLITPEGNELVDTAMFYVITVPEGADAMQRAVISMSSTGWKAARRWNTLITEQRITVKGRAIVAPIYGHTYVLTVVPESNDKGSWYNWGVASGRQVADPSLYEAAKAFREQLIAQFGSGEMTGASAPAEASEESDDASRPY